MRIPPKAQFSSPVHSSFRLFQKKIASTAKIPPQPIELSNSESDIDEDHDILPYGILMNKPDPEKPKPNYSDTMTTIDQKK